MFESSQNVKVGAQSVFFETSGAYTAAVSAPMLKSLECDLVLVGHSERRSVFKESNDDINKSLKQVQAHGMVPILCVGETLQQYESGRNALELISDTFYFLLLRCFLKYQARTRMLSRNN